MADMPSATKAPLRQLTSYQLTAVRREVSEIANKILSGRLTTMSSIKHELSKAASDTSYNVEHFEEALRARVRDFSDDAKTRLPEEIRENFNLVVKAKEPLKTT